MPIVVHSFNDSAHFFIIDFVVLFRRLEFATVKCNRVKESINGISLGNDCSKGEVGGIHFENRRQGRIEVSEDGCRGEGSLELLKGNLLGGIPVKLARFLEKGCYR